MSYAIADPDTATVADCGPFAGLLRQPALSQAANDDLADDAEQSDADEQNSGDAPPQGEKRKPGRRRRFTAEEIKAGDIAIANARLRQTIGSRIGAARRERGWCQADAAKLFGCANSTQLSLWESGRRTIPVEQLAHVARVLECSTDFLFGFSGDQDIDRNGTASRLMLNAVRSTLAKTAEVVVEQIDRHARLVGPNSGDVRGLLAAGDELLGAMQGFMRLNAKAFEGQHGSATLVRCALSFEDQLLDARKKIRLQDALDADLRRSLEALKDADPAHPAGLDDDAD